MPQSLADYQYQQKPHDDDSHRRTDKTAQQNVFHVGAAPILVIRTMPGSFRTFPVARSHRRQKLRRRHLMPVQRRHRKRTRRHPRRGWLRGPHVTAPGFDIHHRMPAGVDLLERISQGIRSLHAPNRNEKTGHPEGWPEGETRKVALWVA